MWGGIPLFWFADKVQIFYLPKKLELTKYYKAKKTWNDLLDKKNQSYRTWGKIKIISLPVHRIITECEALFGRGGLASCGPWGRKELDMTEQLNWTELMRLFYLNAKKYVLLWDKVLAFPVGNETSKQVLSNWKK